MSNQSPNQNKHRITLPSYRVRTIVLIVSLRMSLFAVTELFACLGIEGILSHSVQINLKMSHTEKKIM